MKQSNSPITRTHVAGFSLIELLLIIVVMAFAAVGVIALNSGIFSGQTDNNRIQISTGLMQECAELILANRQKLGYGSVDSASAATLCAGVTVTADGVSYGPPTVQLVSGHSGTGGMGACPYTSGVDCKLVTIQLVTPPIQLLLVKADS